MASIFSQIVRKYFWAFCARPQIAIAQIALIAHVGGCGQAQFQSTSQTAGKEQTTSNSSSPAAGPQGSRESSEPINPRRLEYILNSHNSVTRSAQRIWGALWNDRLNPESSKAFSPNSLQLQAEKTFHAASASQFQNTAQSINAVQSLGVNLDILEDEDLDDFLKSATAANIRFTEVEVIYDEKIKHEKSNSSRIKKATETIQKILPLAQISLKESGSPLHWKVPDSPKEKHTQTQSELAVFILNFLQHSTSKETLVSENPLEAGEVGNFFGTLFNEHLLVFATDLTILATAPTAGKGLINPKTEPSACVVQHENGAYSLLVANPLYTEITIRVLPSELNVSTPKKEGVVIRPHSFLQISLSTY